MKKNELTNLLTKEEVPMPWFLKPFDCGGVLSMCKIPSLIFNTKNKMIKNSSFIHEIVRKQSKVHDSFSAASQANNPSDHRAWQGA